MDQKTLNGILRELGSVGKDRSKEKLWEEVQDVINKDCCGLFLIGEMNVFVVLDDNKVNF